MTSLARPGDKSASLAWLSGAACEYDAICDLYRGKGDETERENVRGARRGGNYAIDPVRFTTLGTGVEEHRGGSN